MFESRKFLSVLLLFGIIPADAAIYSRSPQTVSSLFETSSEYSSEVQFQARVGDSTAYYTRRGLILAGFVPTGSLQEYFELQLRLRGAKEDVEIMNLNPMLAANEQWLTVVPDYARIQYREVYDGIDMICLGNTDRLQIQFVIAPGADLKQIHLQFTGANQTRITPEGVLIVVSGRKIIELPRPLAYQTFDDSGAKRVVDARYVLNTKNEISFGVSPYDSRRPLIINP